jgi:hypothetical protein
LILPGRLHEAKNEPLIDIIFATFAWIHCAIVETLVGHTLLVLDVKTAEATHEDQR